MIRCVWDAHRVAGAAVLEDPQARPSHRQRAGARHLHPHRVR